jgi:hypothetical protein
MTSIIHISFVGERGIRENMEINRGGGTIFRKRRRRESEKPPTMM